MVEAIPNTYIFCRWTFAVYLIVENVKGCGNTKLKNVATREESIVTSDALSWNYVNKIPQEFLQGNN